MTGSFRNFLREEKGSVTIDFVSIFVPVMLFVVMVLEIGIAFHLTSASQKAAQLAARLAAVREPVHADVWSENRTNTENGQAGDACYQPTGDACLDPGVVWVCDGKSLGPECSSDDFTVIIRELQRTYPLVRSTDVSISYIYRRLGVAGGAFVPEVSVTIARRDMPINLLSLVGLLELRPTTASVLGEDMQSDDGTGGAGGVGS